MFYEKTMSTETINGAQYLEMVREGAARLAANRKSINDLNVFPIPDGDTGDNMYMTICAGVDNAAAVARNAAGQTLEQTTEQAAGQTLGQMAAAVSRGMLLGARGNSGVILSRIFAGMAKGLEGCKTAGIAHFRGAMHCGVDEAYKAVATPVEGTILTVLRESVKKADGSTFEAYFEALTAEMRESLMRTPDLLPVLKEACVVDSGGAGMLCIAEGMLDALRGNISTGVAGNTSTGAGTNGTAPSYNIDAFGPDTPLEFGYCTEFLLRLQTAKVGEVEAFDEAPIKEWLEGAGDSLVFFRDGSIIKVHVHTRTPGEVLNACQKWGEFLTLKIENMTLQHSEVNIQDNFSAASPAAGQTATGQTIIVGLPGLIAIP